MKFIAVLMGVTLLAIGLVAYSTIPNVHTIPVQSTSQLTGPTEIVVNPNFQSETQQNVTVLAGKDNTLLVNLTVSNTAGGPASIQFKLFTGSEFGNCMQETNPTGCIVNENVSNQTISVPLNASTTYFFGFDNRDPSASKTVVLSSSLLATSAEEVVSRDGDLNYAALAVGGFGLLVTLYGVVAKTVIPWE